MNHLVDHGWRLEVWTRNSQLLAEAQVWLDGTWTMRRVGERPSVVGGRELAETAMRELVSP